MTSLDEYDRTKELNEFENTKLGVKGLVDSGITRIPRIFHHPPEKLFYPLQTDPNDDDPVIPVIDLSGGRIEVVEQLRDASAKLGFFQVINHGVTVELLDRLLDGVKNFHELDPNEKIRIYRRGSRVGFYSNSELFYSKGACWRDTLAINLAPNPVDPDDIPLVCRSEVVEWDKQVKEVGEKLLGLLSEGLGLNANKLKEKYNPGRYMVGNYYPFCPEPNKTVGVASHTDAGILTILLQNQVGGLQVKYDDKWIDLKPLPGALVVNIGDFFQIISNDEYKSGEHRVYANPLQKARVSIAVLFRPGEYENMYGPLPELVSAERPPLYQQFKFSDLMNKFALREVEGKSMTSYFRL